MGLTTLLRGFKIPVAFLDRYLENNHITPTFGHSPIYNPPLWPGESTPRIDGASAFLRTRLGPGGADTLVFVPQRQGVGKATHAYVAFTYVMVYGQRRLKVPGDLPDTPPTGWKELREEMVELVREGEQGLLDAPGMVGEEGEDPVSMVFVVVTDEREFPFRGPFMRESDRTCGECGVTFDSWADCQTHCKEVHGINIWAGLPDDL
ncbi:hypothetical protein C8A05DRAFT_20592 [Staphylotrichum tortipilum]|uniref:C2H2-type domain-containing protein n=1 Tax=Staphylotrichum tortipilum TaxID=2831512 RepID=A0AAN6M7Y9_9PEZI|nr:hypothetical protein C8A05DRAFT_20592 [Staphylotrichum longicolle]